MARRYMPLQPANPAGSDDGASNTRSESSLARNPSIQRRPAISIACEACRRKRIRCDGKRPACSSCQPTTAQCTYRDEPRMTAEIRRLLLELANLFNSTSEEETKQVIEIFKNEADPWRILCMLRGGIQITQRPSDIAVAGAIMDQSFESMELRSQNQIAYPLLLSLTTGHTEGDVLQQLTTTRSQTRASLPLVLGSSTQDSVGHIEQRDARASPATLCDSRLQFLNITFWTNVQIEDELAASVISLYLTTDHPLLGHFDPDAFIHCLVSQTTEHCSSVFVNALLYWACQMYTSVDSRAGAMASQFCIEAENLWNIEKKNDSVLNMAAAQFLSMAYIGQGKDHAVLTYLNAACSMGTRLGLFGVEEHVTNLRLASLSPELRRTCRYAAWGVFSWIVLVSLFYQQPGVAYPRYPPYMPIPGLEEELESESLPRYMGKTFPHLCKFWSIMHEVALAYYSNGVLPLREHVVLSFAEFKFRELLAWSNSLPTALSRSGGNPHHVLVLHLWFHAAVLDVFRPCIVGPAQKRSRLRTFSSTGSSPDAVYAASVNQLKRLIVNYRLNYKSSAYSILWHTALVYVANAVLQNTSEDDWLSTFLLCIYGYEALRKSWRVAEVITTGLLSMALRKGKISTATARRILDHVRRNTVVNISGELRATFMLDLDLAMSDPLSATVEQLAASFEDNLLFSEFTTI